MAKVTGIGGVFFKSTNDDRKLADWYRKNLGMELAEFGHVAQKDSEWFSQSSSSFIQLPRRQYG